MKQFILFITMMIVLATVHAQTTTRSAFIDGFDKSKYKELTVSDEAQFSYFYNDEAELKRFDGVCVKIKAHIIFKSVIAEQVGGIICFFDGEEMSGWLYPLDLPKEMPLFTSLEVYYHYKANYEDGILALQIDGWKVLDDIRFVGQRYKATDTLKVREYPTLLATQIGRLSKHELVTIIEIGDKATIDDIESAWVKIRTADNKEGWCFAGYLTDGEEYHEKPWTSK
ncbi:MAG: SH3 domain-containing protein [Treponema sp.]|nr:SH3 domain-containing protein [Treponema sp.]